MRDVNYTVSDLEAFRHKYPKIEPLADGYVRVTLRTENPTYTGGTRTDARRIDPRLRLETDGMTLDLYEDVVVYARAHGMEPIELSMRVKNAHTRFGRGRYTRTAAKLALMRVVSDARTPEDRMWHAAAELEAR